MFQPIQPSSASQALTKHVRCALKLCLFQLLHNTQKLVPWSIRHHCQLQEFPLPFQEVRFQPYNCNLSLRPTGLAEKSCKTRSPSPLHQLSSPSHHELHQDFQWDERAMSSRTNPTLTPPDAASWNGLVTQNKSFLLKMGRKIKACWWAVNHSHPHHKLKKTPGKPQQIH